MGPSLLKGFQDHGYFPRRLCPASAVLYWKSSFVRESDKQESDQHSLTRRSLRWGPGWDDLPFGPFGRHSNSNTRKSKKRPSESCTNSWSKSQGKDLPNCWFLHKKKSSGSPQDVLQTCENKKPTTTKRWKRLDASPSLTCCELIFIWKNVVELLSARSWEFLELQWPSSLSGISLHWLLSSLRKRFVALYSGLTWLSTLYLNLLG